MSQIKKWFMQNWDWSIVLVATFITAYASWTLQDLMVSSEGMLQSMIQAQATILGFLGVIVAYIFASYDGRLDRFEQQLFDLEMSNRTEKITSVGKRMEYLKSRKMKTAYGMALVGLMLVTSLVLSIVVLGIRDSSSNLARNLGLFDLTFFFLSIYGMLLTFLRISKEPEEPKKTDSKQ